MGKKLQIDREPSKKLLNITDTIHLCFLDFMESFTSYYTLFFPDSVRIDENPPVEELDNCLNGMESYLPKLSRNIDDLKALLETNKSFLPDAMEQSNTWLRGTLNGMKNALGFFETLFNYIKADIRVINAYSDIRLFIYRLGEVRLV